YVRLNEDSVRLATIAGFRDVWYTSTLGANDGFIPCSQETLSFAERTPFIFASHTIDQAGKRPEYAEQYSTFLVEFIKHWMIDGDSVVFTGEITDYGFGVVGNKNNPTSKLMCIIYLL
ncbi:MAG: hypothetical protein QME57_05225, partial [Patescibacteria group bacterium]|nr:hypothetical protein [Patescibacteria group bacterium]